MCPNLMSVAIVIRQFLSRLAFPVRQHELVADTDASPWGFGMYLGSLCSGGFWGQEERAFSQNGREMRAVELLLTTFVQYLRGRSLLVLTDSATVVSYLNRQGGRFSTLSRVAERILRWCVKERVALRCAHLAGVLNTRSDIRSRWGETMAEWQLNPVVLRQVVRQWGCLHPTMDLFAGRQNRQCAAYFSFAHEPESQGVDALLVSSPKYVEPSDLRWACSHGMFGSLDVVPFPHLRLPTVSACEYLGGAGEYKKQLIRPIILLQRAK